MNYWVNFHKIFRKYYNWSTIDYCFKPQLTQSNTEMFIIQSVWQIMTWCGCVWHLFTTHQHTYIFISTTVFIKRKLWCNQKTCFFFLIRRIYNAFWEVSILWMTASCFFTSLEWDKKLDVMVLLSWLNTSFHMSSC